jgi:hypothetical protein
MPRDRKKTYGDLQADAARSRKRQEREKKPSDTAAAQSNPPAAEQPARSEQLNDRKRR